MASKIGGKCGKTEPPRIELGRCILLKTSSVGAYHRNAGNTQTQQHRYRRFKMLPPAAVVAGPHPRSSLQSGISAAGNQKPPLIWNMLFKPLTGSAVHSGGIQIMKPGKTHWSTRIGYSLQLIRNGIIRPVFSVASEIRR